MSVDADDRIDRQLESMEAEILLEKEGVLPPIGSKESTTPEAARENKEKKIDDLLADLEREAKEEREREAQK